MGSLLRARPILWVVTGANGVAALAVAGALALSGAPSRPPTAAVRPPVPPLAPVTAAVPSRPTVAGYVPDPTTSWALLVGISHYDAPTHPTVGADGDVTAFYFALLKAGWRADHIRVLAEGQATAAAIAANINWLVARSGPATFSVFHYSGHVLQQGGHEFLWGVDNAFISDDDFATAMRSVRGHAWIDVAGCESSGFDRGVASSLRFFTSSSLATQKSYEIPGWHESVWSGLVVDQALLHRAGSARSIEDAVRYGQEYAPQITALQQPYGPQQPYAVGGTGQWFLGPGLAPAA